MTNFRKTPVLKQAFFLADELHVKYKMRLNFIYFYKRINCIVMRRFTAKTLINQSKKTN